MSLSRSALLMISILSVLTNCVSPDKRPKPSSEWVSQMHRLSAAHLRLMPLVADGRQFSRLENRTVIRASMKELIMATEGLLHDAKAPSADPLITYTATRLGVEARQALQTFELNDLEWSRQSLKRVSGYCINCHTRGDRGRSFNLSWQPELSPLALPERVEFLLANRLYDSAFEEALVMAANVRLAERNPSAWLNSLARVQAMLIRTRADIASAERLARLARDNNGAPFYYRSQIAAWLHDLSDWRQERSNKESRPSLNIAARLLKRAQHYGPGRSLAALIVNLRASAILHQLMEDSRASSYGEALLLAGTATQSLAALDLGSLDQYYFENCIRIRPHTPLAESCLDHFEASIYESKLFLDLEPESEWNSASRLAELRRLARVAESTDPFLRRKSWQDDQRGR